MRVKECALTSVHTLLLVVINVCISQSEVYYVKVCTMVYVTLGYGSPCRVSYRLRVFAIKKKIFILHFMNEVCG